ncbi:hypothetical protein CGMCC3_g3603 [Colletotrichum fructicola]|nr:uncharacterized protein CGMCC3_g3603 [Colletotrichum fructicola]KAE9580494.1 hypothetical protein CGMCC3_g3603 [Colletotrichum fructicola]
MRVSVSLCICLSYLSIATAVAVPSDGEAETASQLLTKRAQQCQCDSTAATRDCCKGLGTMGGGLNLECVTDKNSQFLSCCSKKGFIGNVCF